MEKEGLQRMDLTEEEYLNILETLPKESNAPDEDERSS